MFGACAGWGLMAPVGKDAMTHGFDGLSMVTFRVVGACLLFWIASLFAPKEHVPLKDKLMFIGAAVFGLVLTEKAPLAAPTAVWTETVCDPALSCRT